jgi:hypothetical protein
MSIVSAKKESKQMLARTITINSYLDRGLLQEAVKLTFVILGQSPEDDPLFW